MACPYALPVGLESATTVNLFRGQVTFAVPHTCTEIWVGDKNPRLLGALMAVDTEQVASCDSRVQPANAFIFPAT